MSMISARLAFAFTFVVAVLCLTLPAAHAQSVPYWTTTAWPSAFGSGFTAAQGSNTYSSLSGSSLSGSGLAGMGLAAAAFPRASICRTAGLSAASAAQPR
jgi:hypothetical protein